MLGTNVRATVVRRLAAGARHVGLGAGGAAAGKGVRGAARKPRRWRDRCRCARGVDNRNGCLAGAVQPLGLVGRIADVIDAVRLGERAAVPEEILILLHQAATLAEIRSEEHTSELQSLMRNSYAVFCLKKKK